MNRPLIGALMCISGLLLELGLFLKRRFWGGDQPDVGLALGLLVALLVNLYLVLRRTSASREIFGSGIGCFQEKNQSLRQSEL